ncbi:MAG: DNA alkylation repair protein, partial [Culicoidibacterales bacterium]
GNSDARMIAAMIFDPKQLTEAECEQLVLSTDSYQSRDELIAHTLSFSKAAQTLAAKWWNSEDELLARAGWSLVVAKVIANNEPEKIPTYLTKIEAELQQAKGKHQEMMNRALCEIGIRYPEYTEQCLAIGEKIGVYKDVKVAKGCTSPYALAWIPAGIRNREARKKPSKLAQQTQGERTLLTTTATVKVQTIEEYVQSMSPIRQERMQAVIQYVLEEYPQAVATMDFGPKTKFPTFKIGEMYVAIASVKSYLSIHFGKYGATQIVAEAHSRIKANVGCVNIPDTVEFPLEHIKKAIQQTLSADVGAQK